MHHAAPLEFKFRFVNKQGQPEGLLRTKGSFDGERLHLGKGVSCPAVAILQSETRNDRLILALASDKPEPGIVVLAATKGVVNDLKARLDVSRSRFWADASRKALQAEGRGHAHRERECPNCSAVLLLTDMPETPQLYCVYCKALTTADGPEQRVETSHMLCDECGLFSAPRKFTIFYFYFLLVVYGYHQRITWRCPGCMRGEAWKMFFGNLLFVLGVPVAIAQLIRAYGSSRVGRYTGLDKANLLARKGDALAALDVYNEISSRVTPCAGIKYNAGMALVEAQDLEQAAEFFEFSLDDCANYAPAYRALIQCYANTGQHEKRLALQRTWGDTSEEQPERRAG
ncbi:MAG: hypothetical protein KDD82_18185 [Planctomycetes bacterium]|nr:hypothetical protein [Planctomycetota bacterium]